MNKITITLLVLAAFAAGAVLGPKLWAPMSGDAAMSGETTQEREILYWVAPMDPNFRRDEPGKSPMGMDLVPVYADQARAGDEVTISPAVENNLGVRTEAARVRPLWRRVEATGYVGFDETRISHINTRVQGWIARLLVDAENAVAFRLGRRLAASESLLPGDLRFLGVGLAGFLLRLLDDAQVVVALPALDVVGDGLEDDRLDLAIRSVAAGSPFFSPALAGFVAQAFDQASGSPARSRSATRCTAVTWETPSPSSTRCPGTA